MTFIEKDHCLFSEQNRGTDFSLNDVLLQKEQWTGLILNPWFTHSQGWLLTHLSVTYCTCPGGRDLFGHFRRNSSKKKIIACKVADNQVYYELLIVV